MSNYCKKCYELTEQLDQLKAENEKLKLKLRDYMDKYLHELAVGKIDIICKLKQTLTEIKEIAEVLITTTDEYDSCYYKDKCSKCEVKEDCQYIKVEQILQKISECEGNDE